MSFWRARSSSTSCSTVGLAATFLQSGQVVTEACILQKLMSKYHVRRCARCGTGVQKSSGCNKLKCRCGYRFCYVCGSENAQCGHTPSSHGFINNLTGGAEFWNLRDKISPDAPKNASKYNGRPRCKQNHHLALNTKSNGSKHCALCHKSSETYYSCIAGCQFHVCADCYLLPKGA
jgi:hypothetical protein